MFYRRAKSSGRSSRSSRRGGGSEKCSSSGSIRRSKGKKSKQLMRDARDFASSTGFVLPDRDDNDGGTNDYLNAVTNPAGGGLSGPERAWDEDLTNRSSKNDGSGAMDIGDENEDYGNGNDDSRSYLPLYRLAHLDPASDKLNRHRLRALLAKGGEFVSVRACDE